MSDWLDKYLKVNLTAKLTMIASVAMSWRCAEWFMNLEDPTTAQRCICYNGCYDGYIRFVFRQGGQDKMIQLLGVVGNLPRLFLKAR